MIIEENIKKSLYILSYEINESITAIMNKVFNNKASASRIIWFDENQQTLALGSLWQVNKSGKNRFSDVHDSIKALYENSVYLNSVEDNYLSRVFGGFSYFDSCQEEIWDAFKTSNFVLPKYIFFKKENSTTMVLIHSIVETIHHGSVEKSMINEFKDYYSSIPLIDKEITIPKISKIKELTNKKEWIASVEIALNKINHTNLDKVVLARTIHFLSDMHINSFSIFKKLLSSYQTCFNFFFELRPDQVFLGASPELLLQKYDNTISTMALAGTIKRGSTEDEDVHLSKELLSSQKDRREHQIVLEQIIENLNSFVDTETIKYDINPHIHKIHNVQHLRTNISAQLKGEISLLKIINHLHPTPAVGGKPKIEALDLIKTVEKSRGWYASPIGYVKSNLDGKFIVGLRSALIKDCTIHAFAGAGIVDASDPIKEWEETKLKFKPFLNALEVKYDIQ